ncbi:MAG TPA: hypothetical protein PLY64_03430 [Dokdonella sp.]|nr:hypothetical protein [Dokdonella sp.]
MNSPKWMLAPACLALLLGVAAAQAGEISMDVRGLAVATQGPASDDAPAQPSQSSTDAGSYEMPASQSRRWRMISPGSSNQGLADDAGTIAEAPATSTAGSSSNALPTASKPRNRWQSLVPGAIR